MFSYLLPIVAIYVFYESKEFKKDKDFLLLSINLFLLFSALVLSFIIQYNIIDLPGVASIVNFIGEKVRSIFN